MKKLTFISINIYTSKSYIVVWRGTTSRTRYSITVGNGLINMKIIFDIYVNRYLIKS